ncbi:hypothetical protein GCK72_025195 [Caenorhabditis remanei]|uniref:Uncharacterized protein n=1 Tax=Caenorhabditis remanei TaxID=31234 RepID=A0A6A5G1B4_CAERE|nr:hypothetical protein GCK72_025195 [Caenorhabditis remanei]KAF1748728.1 hypothetical protein GCK72_025195 [Caenorhabditis remanei]
MKFFSESATAQITMAPTKKRVKNAGTLAKAPRARQASRVLRKIILGKVPQQEWKFDTTENIVYLRYQTHKMEESLSYSNARTTAILNDLRVATKDEISTRVVGENFYVEEENTGRLFKVQSFRILDQWAHFEVEWVMKRKAEEMMDEEEKEKKNARRAENAAAQ